MLKRVVLICWICLWTACQGIAAEKDVPNSWTVYMYICGSNLESQNGAATQDMTEIINTKLPENVKVLIQTGGAKTWHNNMVKAGKIQRFVHTGEPGTLNSVDEQPDANMSDPATLKDFLAFGQKNFPAQHNAFIFWDHGGGSVVGAISDENHQGDSLTLNEMEEAFSAVYPQPGAKKPFEIIGFDTCLMSTIDTAKNFQPYGKYLVASEEIEPGNGWYYTPWLTALGNNPNMASSDIGKNICDSYMEGCKNVKTDAQATLAVTDLSKLDVLYAAYSQWGQEALEKAADNPGPFLATYSRCAEATENYGGNRPNVGYSNMADLGNLAQNTRDILPQNSAAVLSALQDAVVYKVNGAYRKNSHGLSCFYLYGFEINNLKGYFTVDSASEPFKYLYSYMASGTTMETTVKDYLAKSGQKALPPFATLKTNPLEDAKVAILDDGSAELVIGGPAASMLKSVRFMLVNVSREDDLAIVFGFDNNVRADWENGVFRDNFLGQWGSLDGYHLYMDIVEENADYTIYACPIKLNGEDSNLFVAYDYQKSAYDIIGARPGITNYSTSQKGMHVLKEGDKVAPIICAAHLSTPNDLRAVVGPSFTIGKKPIFKDLPLSDGKGNETFAFIFQMEDFQNNNAMSKVVFFTIKNGKMYLSDKILEK